MTHNIIEFISSYSNLLQKFNISFLNTYVLLLVLYLIVLTIVTLQRKYVTYKGIFYLLIVILFMLVFSSVIFFKNFLLFNSYIEVELLLASISWNTIELGISLKFDSLSFLFTLLVSVIGLATNIYILNYFKNEAHEDVFTLLINWFIFSMIILVLANNLFTVFLGWEAIGLVSFFLINFWNTRRGTIKSSFKAFLFNKISDVFLFIFIMYIVSFFFLNDISIINLKSTEFLSQTNTYFKYAIVSLFLCTLFKSAQLIGHLWLPDSMEAPVPASALIHSATLVSAGLYLLLRFTSFITIFNLHYTAAIIGSITAAYGGLVSASQTDMKKLLAYSTISHCGFLFFTVGTSLYSVTIIYLFLHGLFKASTFFCAGSFIRVAGSQDTRYMGSLNRILPVDTVLLLLCALNLGGLPFTVGYLYKNVFITSLLMNNNMFLLFGFTLIGLLTGLVYTFRLVFYSAFDTIKELYPSLSIELQIKQNNFINQISFTTIIQILATSLILIFSVWIYIYMFNYFFNSYISQNWYPFKLNTLNYFSSNILNLFKFFYEFFYWIYLFIAIILITIVWRIEFTYLYKLNNIIYINIFFYFLVIYSYIFTCEVIFWQKRQHNIILILDFRLINRKF